MPDPSRNVASAAREAFVRWVDGSESGIDFGQVHIESDVNSGYVVRHVDDAGRTDLDAGTSPLKAREVARFTEEGEYRPLKSSPNLRRGWRLDLDGGESLMLALGYLYPAGVVHWYLHREGKLEVTSFRENAGRQSGMYERVKHLTDSGAQLAARACCEDAVCLKRTLWDIDDRTPLEAERGAGEIPCPEPCSVFVSFARKIRTLEKEEVYSDGDGLTPSEREDMGVLLDAASSGRVDYVREAEFDKTMNVRRLRYRNLTLGEKLRASEE